ncbi:serine aminopeptidase domain-containing protein [Aureimonas mangrovi]|uniref:serine aminopeptidase domain-containing protein n=1 Tax=Aureimonas mangrovi TaxID=2758041 RepID=UPI001FE84B8A|nr:alpha/beta hydrolase [Aureimonas mangrovi]
MLAVPQASQTASAESPRLGPFEYPQPRELRSPEGAETFDAYEALHGSVGSPEHCGPGTGRLWVVVGGEGECIRYYHHGLAAENPVALVYFGGDVMLRTQKGVRFISPSYPVQSPTSIETEMARWSGEAGVPAIFIARPGIYGSSGDHNDRRHEREIDLMEGAVQAVVERYGIASLILVGHSAGGQIVAALLNRRRDVDAAVISSGMVSVKQVTNFWERRRSIPGRLLYDASAFHDPVEAIETIRKDPLPQIYVLSDPEDRSVPFFSQLYYVRRLRVTGQEPRHIYAEAPDRQRHLLADHAKLAASLIARGREEADVRRALLELSLEEKAD